VEPKIIPLAVIDSQHGSSIFPQDKFRVCVHLSLQKTRILCPTAPGGAAAGVCLLGRSMGGGEQGGPYLLVGICWHHVGHFHFLRCVRICGKAEVLEPPLDAGLPGGRRRW
jgi:hypothetical protein